MGKGKRDKYMKVPLQTKLQFFKKVLKDGESIKKVKLILPSDGNSFQNQLFNCQNSYQVLKSQKRQEGTQN